MPFSAETGPSFLPEAHSGREVVLGDGGLGTPQGFTEAPGQSSHEEVSRGDFREVRCPSRAVGFLSPTFCLQSLRFG